MKFIFNVLVVTLIAAVVNFSALAGEKSSLPLYSQVYDDQRNAFDDANAALKLAQETNRNVLMVIGGNWCAFCKKMEAFWQSDVSVGQSLHDKYVILKINVSDENKNKEFMAAMPPVLGYPHIYISSANGKLLLSKDTAELQSNEKHDTQLWLTFLDKWQSKQPNS
ncbi:MAG: thioredoxin family protein [Gammaproteobacteria bacterium]|nr:MAG: thioredoxin family protein [Gammaproteobacteria bacterium]